MLYSGRGFVPMMIKRITGSKWSHAAWVVDPETLLEADWELFGKKGVQIEKLSDYKASRRMFLRARVSDEYVEKALMVAMAKIGQRYDFKLFLGLFWHWITSWIKTWDSKVPGSGHAWICSELVAGPHFSECGFRFLEDVPVENVVPGHIGKSLELGRCVQSS